MIVINNSKVKMAFDHYLNNEQLVHGVLKKLNIKCHSQQYDDLLHEGMLKFISTYVDWQELLTTPAQLQKFNRMCFCIIYRHLLNYLKHQRYYEQYHVMTAEQQDLDSLVEFSYQQLEINELLLQLRQHCTTIEWQFILCRYYNHLNMKETSRVLKISTRTAQRIKQRLYQKVQKLI